MSVAAEEGELGAARPKEDPETLVLRGSPRPVVRFRRGLIIGLTGAVAAGLVTVTWLALEPPSFRMAAEEEAGGAAAKGPPDALAEAPRSYGEVPRLGPPLPGDLGRPILEHQREMADPGVGTGPGATPQPDPRVAAAEAERQRLAAAREAARSSGVLVQSSGRRESGAPAASVGAGGEGGAAPEAAVPAPQEAGGRGATAFGRSGPGDVNPHPLRAAPSPWTLSAGTIIPASLVTGLNSDLPGTVIAQVTENVRDSATGRTVLVPQGARLIGSYDNVVAFGQRRALLVWQRIVFPDGSSIRLDNVHVTDLSGYSGVADEVDFRTRRLLTGIALSTLLGVGTERSFGSGESDLVRAVRESTQQNAARAGDRITQRNLDIQPTITVRPGWPLRAVIHKDLVLRPWRGCWQSCACPSCPTGFRSSSRSASRPSSTTRSPIMPGSTRRPTDRPSLSRTSSRQCSRRSSTAIARSGDGRGGASERLECRTSPARADQRPDTRGGPSDGPQPLAHLRADGCGRHRVREGGEFDIDPGGQPPHLHRRQAPPIQARRAAQSVNGFELSFAPAAIAMRGHCAYFPPGRP